MSFKNAPPNVSTKLTFPCTECNFEAQSARQLSRHKAVTHTQNALKCVLCPFVTAYQTNLLRHRKDVHGICGSKGNKSCKFCGFVSEDNDTLIQHQIEYHQDILKSAQAKFAKELLSAAGEENKKDFTTNFESMAEDIRNKTANHSGKKRPKIIIKRNWNQVDTNKLNNNQDDDDFWKAGFIDQYDDHSNLIGQIMNADIHNESMPTSRSSTPKSQSSHVNSNKNDLPATRIRRQYNCTDCGISTTNPRQFLYHRRDIHGYKLKIVECPYCVYACQYVQKLQRHLLLVHKLTSVMNLTNESMTGNNNSNIDLNNLQRKFKKSRIECNDGNIHLDNDDEQGPQPENNSQDNSLNEQDYEQMNFEMSLNEYTNNDDDDMDGNMNDEKKFLFNLECSICKIKFGDAISAQKHFIKHHKHSNLKNIMNMIKENNSLILGSTNQKKVFDSSAKNIHVCKFCGYKTRWISELERHIRVHSKEKPFKCVFCDFRSKWKGDLNRHIQRYHSNEQTLPDLESDNSINGNMNNMSPNEQDDEMINDDSMMNEENEMSFAEMDDNAYCKNIESIDNENSDDFENENDVPVFNGNTAKMYKCTHCDFMCSTASRFHVHYVQHLNTKPFQCSICGHRSNWEWDVTKHIKMKAQRDPSHKKARPVLIHDSGKRDYSKYNRFVVWVGQEEAEVVNENNNKIDFRAKRFKSDSDEFTNDNGMDLLTPEVCFEVDGEANNYTNEQNFNITNDLSLTPTKKYIVKSVIISRHSNSQSKLIKCNHCEFRHHFARVMVAHMSSHNRTKPYSCKQCSFETNWREVIINHYINTHKNTDPNDFEMRFRCVIDENCICRILSVDEVAQMESNNEPASADNISANVSNMNSSLIEPNIYEEKAVIRCELCPFITTNLKKMSIHCRFHNQSKGCLKCKYCPYYVNNHEKLMRHQKLHQKMELINNRSSFIDNSNESTNDTSNYSNNSKRSLIQCSICLFQTYNMQLFSDHMNTYHINGDNDNNNNEFNLGEMANHLEQTITENEVYGNNHHDYIHNTNSIDNEYGDNSFSLPDHMNHMKNNNNGKKYSYTCPDCPAVFKSSGDYKIHAVFHSTNYQHACPYCTYKAKNKPQLGKHLYVHTADYRSKWIDSYSDGGGTNSFLNKDQSHFTNELLAKQMFQSKNSKKSIRKHRTKIEFPMKPVRVKLNSEENGTQNIVFNDTDLMSEQEFLETKEYLQRINSGIKNRCMYRCSKCPAVFTKVNTLIYHNALHGQNGPFTCDACNYSSNSKNNLSIHSLLHNLNESQAALGYNFNYNCHKCPAGFSKRSRLDKHLSLHGAKFNWKCGHCDYSVRYAATLVKHQALHLVNPDFQAIEYENDEDNKETNNLDSFNADTSTTPNTSTDEGLKLKLNIANLRDKIADDDNYDIPMDSNDENVAENNSQQEENYENDYDINPVLIMEEGED